MKNKQQRGGTIIGFILGTLVGLAVALAVAVYVTKVPIPFVNKIKSQTSSKDEAQRNKDWVINGPLYGKDGAQPANAPAAPATPATPQAADKSTAAPAAAGQAPASSDPLGDLARARSAAASAPAVAAAAPAAGADPYGYFVQAGAFRAEKEADAQRAKLAMLGWEARVSEREQNGRSVFRVRVGPFAKRDDAEALKGKLEAAGVESNLVRVQR